MGKGPAYEDGAAEPAEDHVAWGGIVGIVPRGITMLGMWPIFGMWPMGTVLMGAMAMGADAMNDIQPPAGCPPDEGGMREAACIWGVGTRAP